MIYNRQVIKKTCWLLLYSLVLLGCAYLYQLRGLSAVLMPCLLLLIYVTIKLVNLHRRSEMQVEQVIKALANNDPTLGLTLRSSLANKLEQIRVQIQQTRLDAQIQTQYLETLMIHLDVSILVVDEQGKILRHNPASEQLLGRFDDDIMKLGQLGQFISENNKNRRATLPWQHGEIPDTLSVHVSCCQIQGQTLKLVSIQSIYQALVAKEQQAYKRLTRVLTHEVANSITPLASLAQTAVDLLPEELEFSEQEDKDDLHLALTTLTSRSQHLSEFIKSFHKIAALPQPQLKQVQPKELVEQVLTLFQSQAKHELVTLSFEVQSSCLLMADAVQIEQVLINIIKNAFYALQSREQKLIILRLWQQQSPQQLCLDITDTGCGITPQAKEQIFVPFFTTKQKGSGIGLSLSRQIMLQHGGDLNYIDKPESGACFRLTFS
ncbi:MAG: PAS domain-containing protein [Alteromonadaceae bacterium]|nr:PAS domain-containing protein [Alteromonadaceae bacterium]